jgi:hypothetical protein
MQLMELLRLPVYSNILILAGKSGLTRQVQSVNMMDAPDIIDFLKPNELLLRRLTPFAKSGGTAEARPANGRQSMRRLGNKDG